MAYASYNYYIGEYKGSLSEEEFNRFSRKASAYIDTITFNRASGAMSGIFADRIKEACCGIVDVMMKNENGGGVASETNDGISVTYVSAGDEKKSPEQRLYAEALTYLGTTGLMYRG